MTTMPRAQSVPPTSTDDRTTERRIVPTSPISVPADSRREVTQEDFLFHLYRGSELLQENRVFEAKEELEFALTMQPSDPKGQDLLGAVYFRLGHYPRAIQIYEGLEASFPNDVSIKVNLALGYLKTGQPDPARRMLQDAVRIQPEHKRAWGYLGLALQKLGDLDGARVAFERGGHGMMAKRAAERAQRSAPTPPVEGHGFDEGVRSMAETAFSELDAGELRFALAEPAQPRPGDGPWHTLEIGDATGPRSVPPPPMTPPPRSVHDTATKPPPAASTRMMPPPIAHAPVPAPAVTPAAEGGPAGIAPPLLASNDDVPLAALSNGVVRAHVAGELAFATRLDALRVVAGAITTRVLHRRSREADTSEILGGLGSPFVRVSGEAQLVLGARPSHRLWVVPVSDEIAFVREESLLGFESRLVYENGRLALDPPGEGPRSGETAHLVQLRGQGALVLEIAAELATLQCTAGVPLYVRREWIVGWLGRLMPRALPPTESPSGQRGLVAFAGEGTVMVCAS